MSERVRNRQGYTLIELMVAAMIIAIIAIFVVPSFKTYARNWEARGEVRELVSILQRARIEAVKRKNVACIELTTTTGATDMGGSYRLYVDSNGNGVWDAGEELTDKTISSRVALYGESPAGWHARFDSQGLADGAGSVRLANSTPVYYKISISKTGNIRVQKSSDEGAL